MAPRDDTLGLRADIPALEPDAVLLDRLVELSAASTAAARRRRSPLRALGISAAALGVLAGTSWIAGALPGVPSPVAPERSPAPTQPAPAGSSHTTGHPSSAAVPTSPTTAAPTTTPTGGARVPGAAVSPTSGVPSPHTGMPGVGPSSSTATGDPAQPPSAQPTTPAGGRAIGRGPEEHPDRGRHLGQQKHEQRSDEPKGKAAGTGSPKVKPSPSGRSRPTSAAQATRPPRPTHPAPADPDRRGSAPSEPQDTATDP